MPQSTENARVCEQCGWRDGSLFEAGSEPTLAPKATPAPTAAMKG
jgi:hypothetical protein